MSEEDIAGLSRESRTQTRVQRLPRAVAEEHAYRGSDGCIEHPSSSITSLLRVAGRNHKQRTSRRTLLYLIAPGVRMGAPTIPLFDAQGERLRDFEVDIRTGVNHNARGARVVVIRPRYDSWSSQFTMRVNRGVIEPEQIHQLLVEGGMLAGIGAFRPEKNGEFGTFQVTLWENVPDSAVERRKSQESIIT